MFSHPRQVFSAFSDGRLVIAELVIVERRGYEVVGEHPLSAGHDARQEEALEVTALPAATDVAMNSRDGSAFLAPSAHIVSSGGLMSVVKPVPCVSATSLSDPGSGLRSLQSCVPEASEERWILVQWPETMSTVLRGAVVVL